MTGMEMLHMVHLHYGVRRRKGQFFTLTDLLKVKMNKRGSDIDLYNFYYTWRMILSRITVRPVGEVLTTVHEHFFEEVFFSQSMTTHFRGRYDEKCEAIGHDYGADMSEVYTWVMGRIQHYLEDKQWKATRKAHDKHVDKVTAQAASGQHPAAAGPNAKGETKGENGKGGAGAGKGGKPWLAQWNIPQYPPVPQPKNTPSTPGPKKKLCAVFKAGHRCSGCSDSHDHAQRRQAWADKAQAAAGQVQPARTPRNNSPAWTNVWNVWNNKAVPGQPHTSPRSGKRKCYANSHGVCKGGCGMDHGALTNEERATRDKWEENLIASGKKPPYDIPPVKIAAIKQKIAAAKGKGKGKGNKKGGKGGKSKGKGKGKGKSKGKGKPRAPSPNGGLSAFHTAERKKEACRWVMLGKPCPYEKTQQGCAFGHGKQLIEAAKRARGGGKNVAPAIRREAGIPEPSEWDMSTGIWSDEVGDDDAWYADATLEHHEVDDSYPDESYDGSLNEYYSYDEGYWVDTEDDYYSLFEEVPPGVFRDDELYNDNE